MRRLSLAALVVALAACVDPSQFDKDRWGTVTVAFGPPLDPVHVGPWRPDQLAALRATLRGLAALGPSFEEASEGSAMVVVRPYEATAHCASGVGRFEPGTDFIEVDPACSHGYEPLQSAMAHELGHFLAMQHVCAPGSRAPDCSPVGIGWAVMNPHNEYDAQCSTCQSGEGVATSKPTDLDLAEYRRTHP